MRENNLFTITTLLFVVFTLVRSASGNYARPNLESEELNVCYDDDVERELILDKLRCEQENLELTIQNKKDNSCYVKIFSKYLWKLNNDEDNEKINREQLIKLISIELTRCLFEIDDLMPQIDSEYCNNLNYYDYELDRNINKCIGFFSRDVVIWTTFNGYLTQVDNLLDKNLVKVENMKILEEYKNIIVNLTFYVNQLIMNGNEERERGKDEREKELEEFRNLKREMRDEMDKIIFEMGEKMENSMAQLVNDTNIEIQTGINKFQLYPQGETNQAKITQTGWNGKSVLQSKRVIVKICTFAIVIISIYLVNSVIGYRGNNMNLQDALNRYYGTRELKLVDESEPAVGGFPKLNEQAILERLVALLIGVSISVLLRPVMGYIVDSVNRWRSTDQLIN